MKILIDADACPVVKIVEEIALKYQIEVIEFCDTSHILFSSYAKVVLVSKGADSVDFKLVNECEKGDIAVTQDYGLAAMVLSKGGFAIHQNGMIYSDSNIPFLLDRRYEAKKIRNSQAKHHLKGPKKRTKEDDEKFISSLEKLINEII